VSTETTERPRTADERLAAGETFLSLSQCAEILHMKRPNVAKFLARRGIEPAVAKAQGYFWWSGDVERVKSEREADDRRMDADRRRRETALARRHGEPVEPMPEIVRLGGTQRTLMEEMLRRPVHQTDTTRFALLRLRKRGYCDRIGEDGTWALTAQGREVAGNLS
jgi:hypothetical protein